jgi:hypothetical protein
VLIKSETWNLLNYYAASNGNYSDFGGLVVSMLASGTLKFADLNPAEAVEFFGAKTSSACLPSEGK